MASIADRALPGRRHTIPDISSGVLQTTRRKRFRARTDPTNGVTVTGTRCPELDRTRLGLPVRIWPLPPRKGPPPHGIRAGRAVLLDRAMAARAHTVPWRHVQLTVSIDGVQRRSTAQ